MIILGNDKIDLVTNVGTYFKALPFPGQQDIVQTMWGAIGSNPSRGVTKVVLTKSRRSPEVVLKQKGMKTVPSTSFFLSGKV